METYRSRPGGQPLQRKYKLFGGVGGDQPEFCELLSLFEDELCRIEMQREVKRIPKDIEFRVESALIAVSV